MKRNLKLSFLLYIMITFLIYNSYADNTLNYDQGVFVDIDSHPNKESERSFLKKELVEIKDNNLQTFISSELDIVYLTIYFKKKVLINRIEIVWSDKQNLNVSKEIKVWNLSISAKNNGFEKYKENILSDTVMTKTWKSYEIAMADYINSIEIAGFKSKDTINNFTLSELRFYGVEGTDEVTIKVRAMADENAAEVIIDNEDTYAGNQYAYCNDNDNFEISTAGGYIWKLFKKKNI